MRVFSGIRPSGDLHLGNYLGAIRQWLQLQEKEECLFCIVDLHAITTPYEPKNLQEQIRKTAIAYLAAGLDPEKSIIFIQSKIPEHTELAWILGTITPLGDLKRMTQFKEKSKKYPNAINAGLLNYPVLMAADILLYLAEIVPVGKDQEQHVELAREIARKFNLRFGKTFPEPKALINEKSEKIMSLQEPTKKMSKTDNPLSFLGLFDSEELIKEKILKAVTDSGSEIIFDPKRKPGLSNLLNIYSIFSDLPIKKVEEKFRGKGYFDFKKSLANLLIEKLKPFRQKQKEYAKRTVFIEEILEKGRKKAQLISQQTMTLVRKKIGLN
jgi:tryptophanyl-tRNA synthetase